MGSPVKRDKVISGLQRKGFEREPGDHEFFVYRFTNGKISRSRTKVSRGTNYAEIGDSLIGPMAKQCGLSMNEFRELINCPLSRDSFEQIISSKGY